MRIDEVVDAHGLRVAFQRPLTPAVLEVLDPFFLFGINGYHRISRRLIPRRRRDNMAELGVAIGRPPPFVNLPGRLQV